MRGLYWYISQQKVDVLSKEYAPDRLGWLKEVSLKLKAPPFIEAAATVKPGHSLVRDVGRIRNSVLANSLTPAFPNLPNDRPIALFSFSGHALRSVHRGAFWVIMHSESSALLLGGALSNAVGAPPKEAGDVSPSVDPIGAVRRAFEDSPKASGKPDAGVSAVCSYVWQAMARPFSTTWNALPQVEGIAAFAGIYPAAKEQFRRSGFEQIQQIVVGSPVYVRQV